MSKESWICISFLKAYSFTLCGGLAVMSLCFCCYHLSLPPCVATCCSWLCRSIPVRRLSELVLVERWLVPLLWLTASYPAALRHLLGLCRTVRPRLLVLLLVVQCHQDRCRIARHSLTTMPGTTGRRQFVRATLLNVVLLTSTAPWYRRHSDDRIRCIPPTFKSTTACPLILSRSSLFCCHCWNFYLASSRCCVCCCLFVTLFVH